MYKLCLTTVIYSNTSYLFCQDLFLFFSRFYALFLFKRLSRLCVTVFLRTAYLYYHNSNNLSIPFFDIFCPIVSALKRQLIYINRYFSLCQHFFAFFYILLKQKSKYRVLINKIHQRACGVIVFPHYIKAFAEKLFLIFF